MINELVEKYLLEERAKEESRAGKIRPSRLGRCHRYQYWAREGIKESNPVPVEVLKIFKCGDIFHQFVQQVFPSEQVEVEVFAPDIEGHADIVSEEEVIDIKSVRSYAFVKMSKKGYDVRVEKHENILQVMTYAWLLDKKVGRLVYINKDSLEIREFTFDMVEWVGKVLDELEVVRDYWKRKVLPPAIPRCYINKEGKSLGCSYCVFRDSCKEVENG